MLQYIQTQQKDKSQRIWYGVLALEDGKPAAHARQLSTNAWSVQALVARMNEYSASLVHFSEFIEDYLAFGI